MAEPLCSQGHLDCGCTDVPGAGWTADSLNQDPLFHAIQRKLCPRWVMLGCTGFQAGTSGFV